MDGGPTVPIEFSSLTYAEVLECFSKALDRLNPKDRAEIEFMIHSATGIKNMGQGSALELVGKLAIWTMTKEVKGPWKSIV